MVGNSETAQREFILANSDQPEEFWMTRAELATAARLGERGSGGRRSPVPVGREALLGISAIAEDKNEESYGRGLARFRAVGNAVRAARRFQAFGSVATTADDGGEWSRVLRQEPAWSLLTGLLSEAFETEDDAASIASGSFPPSPSAEAGDEAWVKVSPGSTPPPPLATSPLSSDNDASRTALMRRPWVLDLGVGDLVDVNVAR
jgi:hypothetical protein